MMTISVREYVGPEAMDVLALQWRELYAADELATPYQSPAWLTAWARQLPHTATPIVLAVTRSSGQILSALALARHTDHDRTRILPLSAPHAESVRPIGPHADDPAVARALTFHLLLADSAGADVLMTDVPATSALGTCLTLACQDTDWGRTTAPSAAIPLPFHYDSLPPVVQREHARRRRTWARLVRARTITYARTRCTQELLAAFDGLCQLHQQRWEGHDLLPGTVGTAEADHWREVLCDLGGTHASIASLAVGDTPIAAQLLLTRGARCYSLIPAIDPGHRHLAPGHALLRHLISDLAAEGFHILDLGRTTGPQQFYRRQYAPQWTATVSARSTPELAAA